MSEQKTKHNGGRAYQCRYCLEAGKEYINEKNRMENHIRNTHLRPDQLPYYCQLCKFHCTKREELDNHVKNYRWHAKRLFDAKGNPILDSPDFLMENPTPYVIGPQDYIKLSKSDSDHYYAQKKEALKSSSSTGDLLAQAVQTFQRGPEDMHTDLLEVQAPSLSQESTVTTTVANVSNLGEAGSTFSTGTTPQFTDVQQVPAMTVASPVVLTPLSLGPTYVPQVFNLLQALLGTPMAGNPGPSNSLTRSVDSLVGPTTVTTELMSTVQNRSTQETTSTPKVHHFDSAAPLDLTQASRCNECMPLDLSTTRASRGETTLQQPQFVPCAMNGFSQRPTEEPVVNTRSTTPDLLDSTSTDKTENPSRPEANEQEPLEENLLTQLLGHGEEGSLSPIKDDCQAVKTRKSEQQQGNNNINHNDQFNTMIESLKQENKLLRDEVERNSRSVRCMEKTVEREMKEQTKTLNLINDNITNLITYLRTNAREERRRKEREEEEKRKEQEEEKRRDEDRKRKRESHEDENQDPARLKSVLGEIRKNKRQK